MEREVGQILLERRQEQGPGVFIGGGERPRADQSGAQDRRLAPRGDRLECSNHVRQSLGLSAADPGLDQIEHRWPTHEAVKLRSVLVEYRPQVAKRLFVASIAKRLRTPREVRGGQQRAALHRPQGPLRLGDPRFEVGFGPAQRRGKRGNELRCEAVLRLVGVASQPERLRCRPPRLPPTHLPVSPPRRSARALG